MKFGRSLLSPVAPVGSVGSVGSVEVVAVAVAVFETASEQEHYRGCIVQGYFDRAFPQAHQMRKTGT